MDLIPCSVKLNFCSVEFNSLLGNLANLADVLLKHQ